MAIQAAKHGGAVDVDLEIELGPLERRVPVRITLDGRRISIRRKGRRRAIGADWDAVVTRLVPGLDAPAKYLSNPAGVLVDG
ncbi:MAG TPA: hypothetical protein VM219_03690 [Phycisphaerae bacterium]|nr:hypothetical protein [Phycisphaerae bacterium]HUX00387.1 hypothetical protein [Phycisphaerae bacterium]